MEDLRRRLEHAVGVSEYAIVIYADVRGFSDFSDDHESPDVATYIRAVFMHMSTTTSRSAHFTSPLAMVS